MKIEIWCLCFGEFLAPLPGLGKGWRGFLASRLSELSGFAIGIGIAFGIFRAFCWIAWFPGASGARHGAAGAAQESRDASGHNDNDNRFADNGKKVQVSNM